MLQVVQPGAQNQSATGRRDWMPAMSTVDPPTRVWVPAGAGTDPASAVPAGAETPSAAHATSVMAIANIASTLRTTRAYIPASVAPFPVTEPHIPPCTGRACRTQGYFPAMSIRLRCALSVLVAAAAVPLQLREVSASSTPQKEICADFFGVVRCVVVTEPPPKSPSTTPGMQAVASPKTVRVDGTVTVTAGGRPGGQGFSKGEVVRLFEFWKGKATELTGTKFADGKGSITFKREYLSLVGVDTEGPRTLCARGEKSLRMACTGITVGTTSTATTVPAAPTSGPKSAKTTTGMKTKGTRGTVAPGQVTKITFGPVPGKKGFTPGEKIALYDFVDGTRVTLDTGKAGSNGSVTFSAGWTADTTYDTTHELCSYGMTSKKMACYTVETDGYGAPPAAATTTTVAPAPVTTAAPVAPTTTASTVPRTTLPPYGPPVAG